MCLIVLANDLHSDYELIVAANRDEFYDRPTAPLNAWGTHPEIYAGKDLQGGGTWMGVDEQGRFAALTNFRDPARRRTDAPTRGTLVSAFLQGSASPARYVAELSQAASKFNDFNLIVGTPDNLVWVSNRHAAVRVLGRGVFGLSNHLLDTPWPKVQRARQMVLDALGQSGENLVERLLQILQDEEVAPDAALPDTGVGLAWERVLAPIFISSPTYGTRSSSVVLFDRSGKITFVEKTHDPVAPSDVPRRISIQVAQPEKLLRN